MNFLLVELLECIQGIERIKIMKAKATAKHIRQSPFKLRKTLNSVKGMSVGVAMDRLHFSPEKAATVIEKTLRSAVSNLMSAMDDQNINPQSLVIDEAFVDGGPVMKRFRASAMGRVSRRRRPTSHLTIIVSDT